MVYAEYVLQERRCSHSWGHLYFLSGVCNSNNMGRKELTMQKNVIEDVFGTKENDTDSMT